MSRRLFRKADAPDDVTGMLAHDLDIGAGKARIRCPRCLWQPKKADRWQCVCSHLWHTFDTRGRCPECSSQWNHTQCLRCAEWSTLRAWYDDGIK